MNIENKTNLSNFGDLHPGDAFKISKDYGDLVFIKVKSGSAQTGREANCFDLLYGSGFILEANRQVQAVKAKVVVEG